MGALELHAYHINDMGAKTKNFGIFVIFEIIILYSVELVISIYSLTLGFQRTEIGVLRGIINLVFFQIFLVLMINSIGYFLMYKLVMSQRSLRRVLENSNKTMEKTSITLGIFLVLSILYWIINFYFSIQLYNEIQKVLDTGSIDETNFNSMVSRNNRFTFISGIILASMLYFGVKRYEAWTNEYSVGYRIQFIADVETGFKHCTFGVALMMLGNFTTLYFSFGSLLGLIGVIRFGFGFNMIGTGLEHFQPNLQ